MTLLVNKLLRSRQFSISIKLFINFAHTPPKANIFSVVHTTFHWPHATDHECSHINWLDSRTIEETAKQKEKATGQFLFENGK